MYTNCSKYMNELLTLFSNHAGINASLSKSLYVLTELKTVEMSFISLFTVYMWQLTAIPMYCIFWLILYIVWLQDIYKYWHSRTHRVSRRAWLIYNIGDDNTNWYEACMYLLQLNCARMKVIIYWVREDWLVVEMFFISKKLFWQLTDSWQTADS